MAQARRQDEGQVGRQPAEAWVGPGLAAGSGPNMASTLLGDVAGPRGGPV